MLYTTSTAARAFQPSAPIRRTATPMRDNRRGREQASQRTTRRRVRFGLAIAAMK